MVTADSVGCVYIKTSTLYHLLASLTDDGFIVADRPYYELAPKGWQTLERELARLKQYVQLLQVRLAPRR